MAEGEEQRFEFNFSKMQLIMIASGVFILAAVMFALGMVVGKSLAEIKTIVAQPVPHETSALPPTPAQEAPATAEHAPPAPTAPATAPQEGLTPVIPPVEPHATPTPAPEAAKTEAPAQQKTQPQTERPVIQPLPSPPINLPEPTIMQTQTPQSMQPSAGEAETKSKPAETTSVKPASKPEKTAAKTRKSKSTASSQKYLLQAASFSDRTEAENLIQTLKKRGIRATIVPIDIEGKGTWHRVRTGPYRSREEAEKYIEKLQMINGLGLTPMLIAAD
ncbi:MAG: SPOR domain-containing protein [Nitrospirota bacterium]|nr:SPOR domain-containing protein [Nitrospirota bacterium]